jgi:hypothetical protein
MTGTEMLKAEIEKLSKTRNQIAEARFQMELFRKKGNYHGWKQAKAHYERLLKKARKR